MTDTKTREAIEAQTTAYIEDNQFSTLDWSLVEHAYKTGMEEGINYRNEQLEAKLREAETMLDDIAILLEWPLKQRERYRQIDLIRALLNPTTDKE